MPWSSCSPLTAVTAVSRMLLGAQAALGPGWKHLALGAACPFSKPASVPYSSLALLEKEKLTYAWGGRDWPWSDCLCELLAYLEACTVLFSDPTPGKMDYGADDPLAMAVMQWQCVFFIFIFSFIFLQDFFIPRRLGALLTSGSITKLPLGSSWLPEHENFLALC